MTQIVRKREGREPATPTNIAEPFRTAALWDPFRRMRSLLGFDPFMRWDPFSRMESVVMPSGEQVFVPDIDVRETKDAYLFSADLPGIREDELDISITGNTLSISGKREEEEREEGERYYSYERSYGSFCRSFTLPEGADLNRIEADLQNGVLHINVPKIEEVQPKRISVKGGKVEERAPATAVSGREQGGQAMPRAQGGQGSGEQTSGRQGGSREKAA